jgi:multidrug efflux pump subunit AcrA (membrane-fusion protein)
MADRETARGRGFRRSRVVIGIVVLVLLGGGVAAWAATRTTDPTYRTAVAGPATVTSVLNGIGTIQPVSEATVTFPVSGQVATVNVKQGDQVTAGEVLAQLNTTTLSGQVSSAQSTLATAQAKLASDQSSQTSGASSQGGSRLSAQLTQLLKSIAAGQNSVRGAQQKVDSDLTLAGAALKQAQTTCSDVIKTLGAGTPPPVDVNACTKLLQQVQDAQGKTSDDEHALSTAEGQLSTALGQAASLVRSSSSAPATTRKSTASTPPSADQIAADQASVDAANAQLAANQQNLAAANLVSPIDGTVAQVDVSTGQNASVNSSSSRIVIIGPGADQVTTAASDQQVGQVKPGEVATITPDGATKPLTGKVTAIGALATTTSNGTASFPVTISLDSSSSTLFAGSTASVSITLGSAKAAVTVPTSAVHTVGSASFVTTLSGDTTATKRVTLGVVGSAVTQITQGINAGDQVVLADLGQALPSANTTTRGLTGGGGAAGGARGGGGRAGG